MSKGCQFHVLFHVVPLDQLSLAPAHSNTKPLYIFNPTYSVLSHGNFLENWTLPQNRRKGPHLYYAQMKIEHIDRGEIKEEMVTDVVCALAIGGRCGACKFQESIIG